MCISRPNDLAAVLKTPLRELYRVIHHADDYYEELELPPKAPGKSPRRVANPRGALRRLQRALYDRVLLPRARKSPYSHGGVRGRNVLSNLHEHIGQNFVLTADICNFYPSIHHSRVWDLFIDLGFTREVAGLCTRLCTHKYRVEQGLITSPFLADRLLQPVDNRIVALARQWGLVYTRFVDDIALSGMFDLEDGEDRLIRILREILLQSGGFGIGKIQCGSFTEGAELTGIRVVSGHPDVRKDYLCEVERQIADAGELANCGTFVGPYYTEAQIRGRVAFIAWVNPGRRRTLCAKIRSVDWNRVREEAGRRGLQRVVQRCQRVGAS